ncbi:immunodominant staphylococcal antigen IsaB family protein, partial [Staphylococcus saprophyticus]
MLSTTTTLTSNSTFIPHPSQNIHYQLNPYTTHPNHFIFHPSFIQPLKNNNFLINPYNITPNQQQHTSIIDIYHQIIPNTPHQTPSILHFQLNNPPLSNQPLIHQYP